MIDKILNDQKIIAGCMRLNTLDYKSAEHFILNAIDRGVTFFDHADIYGNGECEKLFGDILKNNPNLREKITLQSKCAIVPGIMYDFSKEHILKSVDNSLKKLNTNHIDYFLLHRPDALCEPEEVADAFNTLKDSGKVLNFGVSNHTPMQIELLRKYIKQPIKINQMQLSITNATMITAGIQANTFLDTAIDRDGSVLDYCRLNDITIQAWSPLQYGTFSGIFIGNEKFPELNKKLEEIAKIYNVCPATIATAWILRHPAKMQVISGSTNEAHFKEVADAKNIKLTRKQWYEIYKAAGYILP